MQKWDCWIIWQFYFSVFHFFKLIYLFIFGCIGSLLLRVSFLQLRRAGATLLWGVRASHCGGFSGCGAWALGARGFSSCGTWAQQLCLMGSRAQAQQLCTGLFAPRHVGSSRTRARMPVPCIGRWILNHCATREALVVLFLIFGEPPYCFPQCLYQFTFPPAVYKGYLFCTSLAWLLFTDWQIQARKGKET